LIANRPEKDLAVFEVRFLRCRRLLHFIASRVLGGSERADVAVENCRVTASRNPSRFEYEGAFRCWLLRVLIDEALAILHENQGSAQAETGLPRDCVGARNQLHEKRIVLLKQPQKESTENV
jgi:DNA-directed RNA polymerase specialized sigma24 family protein